MLSICLAVSQNGVIGNGDRIPWNIPEDRARFRELIRGKQCFVGRKTFETLPMSVLRNSFLSVITKRRAATANLFNAALQKAQASAEEMIVIGGAEVARQALPYAEKLYITRVFNDYDGDAFFPQRLYENNFTLAEAVSHQYDGLVFEYQIWICRS